MFSCFSSLALYFFIKLSSRFSSSFISPEGFCALLLRASVDGSTGGTSSKSSESSFSISTTLFSAEKGFPINSLAF